VQSRRRKPINSPPGTHGNERRVDSALKALPERKRLAETLLSLEAEPERSGAAMGISDEADESLLARARRALRVSLKDE